MSHLLKTHHGGWRPNTPDPRDRTFGLAEEVFEAHQLPAKYSLRDQFSTAVFDQLQIGTCVPNHAVENVLFRAHQLSVSTGLAHDDPMLSRLFVYYEGRKADGLPTDQDTGMSVRTAFQVLRKLGAPPEADWAYSDAQPGPFAEKPPPNAYLDAVKFEIVEFKAVVVGQPGAPMRSAIFHGMPITYGFPVPDYFETYDAANDYLRLPDANTKFIGGHCESVIGWDYTLARFPVPVFEVRNSWNGWGDEGHHWADARWFSPQGKLASDLTVITKVSR